MSFVPIFAPATLTETVIYLSNTATSTWVVPANWNSANNSIECIGGGGGGGVRGQAGAGGHYAKSVNVSLSGTVNCSIGTGGAAFTNGGDSWIGGTNLATSVCGAQGGRGGKNGSLVNDVNFDTSLNIASISYAGGDGGNNVSVDAEAGFPGGGGAAGPLGRGGNGGAGGVGTALDAGGGGGGANGGTNGGDAADNVPGNGGNSGDGGLGGTALTAATFGGGGRGAPAGSLVVGSGANGWPVWTQTSDGNLAGPGGGGGGSSGSTSTVNFAGGGGGLYGGAGGREEQSAGVGGQGLIVIRYRHT